MQYSHSKVQQPAKQLLHLNIQQHPTWHKGHDQAAKMRTLTLAFVAPKCLKGLFYAALHLRRVDTLGNFFHHIFKEGNFCDFLFAFLHTEKVYSSQKKSTLKGKNLLPMGANSFLLV